MTHEKYLNEIKKDRARQSFVYPDYGRYSIAEIVPTVLSMFGVLTGRAIFPHSILSRMERPEKLVFFIVDGFGFERFTDLKRRIPFLTNLERKMDIFPITSVFPSTTPAALTTLHTGLTPQEHGLPEWTVFFEEFDSIIETLPFRAHRTPGRDTLLAKGGLPEMLYEGPTVYEELAKAGVPSYIFSYYEYFRSAYSTATQRGALSMPYIDEEDLMEKLAHVLNSQQGKGYYVVYIGKIDAVQHEFGPDSPEHLSAWQRLSQAITDTLLPKLKKTAAADALFMLSADHGHTSIEKEQMIYLNQYLELEASYLLNKNRKSIVPTGAPHDVFLFITKTKTKDIVRLLRHELDGKADVLETAEALGRGMFGLGKPSEKFLRRIGDVLILPYKGRHVWYEHGPGEAFRQKGIHGGLSETEMIVPLIVGQLETLL